MGITSLRHDGGVVAAVLCAADLEALRTESGVPPMGSELSDDAIPAATGILDRSASFTKGCYTGPGLVAPMDRRGNHSPQRLIIAANHLGSIDSILSRSSEFLFA